MRAGRECATLCIAGRVEIASAETCRDRPDVARGYAGPESFIAGGDQVHFSPHHRKDAAITGQVGSSQTQQRGDARNGDEVVTASAPVSANTNGLVCERTIRSSTLRSGELAPVTRRPGRGPIGPRWKSRWPDSERKAQWRSTRPAGRARSESPKCGRRASRSLVAPTAPLGSFPMIISARAARRALRKASKNYHRCPPEDTARSERISTAQPRPRSRISFDGMRSR